jgi:hypothetical protein
MHIAATVSISNWRRERETSRLPSRADGHAKEPGPERGHPPISRIDISLCRLAAVVRRRHDPADADGPVIRLVGDARFAKVTVHRGSYNPHDAWRHA